jgi:hypothetical protein
MGLLARLEARVLAPFHRHRFPIYVDAPPYNPRSGGSRAMNLLACHLARLGYDAYALARPPEGAPVVPGVRYLEAEVRALHAGSGRKPIAVYPEVIAGNPIGAPFVVRFLLNMPGYLVPGVEYSYAAEDLYLCFDPSYAPPGRPAFDLYMPLVDRSSYFPPPAGAVRQGFVIFTNRREPDASALPEWVSPAVVVSLRAPRPHAELADLYRRSLAMVTWERSSAIYEALCCGCPVICIADGPFRQATYQRRFGGAGLVWGWQRDRLAQAATEVARFDRLYRDLEESLDQRIRTAFDSIIGHIRRRMA